MRLNGQQIGEFRDILVAAFSRNDLKQLVLVKLNIVLEETVPTDDAWRMVAFNLIVSLNQEEKCIELVRVIRAERPNVTTLVAWCDNLLAQANGVAPSAAPGSLRQAVSDFNDGFQARIKLFDYLSAYKELHDVLHELQSFHPKVAAAAAERVADPSQALSDDVAFFLEDSVRKAH